MSRPFLMDTNHLSAAINPVSPLRDRLLQEHRAGARFRTIVPVVCEVEIGIQDSSFIESYRRQLHHLLRKVTLIPLERAMAQQYGEVFRELRRKGKALSQVDIMLAALTRQSGWTLLTSDKDFEALPDMRSENWLDTGHDAP